MAAPVAGYVQLPSDSGNSGKKVRTQTRVVGADTVHHHFMVPIREAAVLGVYKLFSAIQSVQASAQNGTSTGFLWLHVPSSVTGKKVRIRRVWSSHAVTNTTANPTLPRLMAQRFTFTGAASGASVTLTKMDSGYPTPVLDVRSASTGLTVSLVASAFVGGTLIPPTITAGTAASFVTQTIPDQFLFNSVSDTEDDFLVLAPGEGVVIYQPDAGTASDSRRFTLNIVHDEVDVS